MAVTYIGAIGSSEANGALKKNQTITFSILKKFSVPIATLQYFSQPHIKLYATPMSLVAADTMNSVKVYKTVTAEIVSMLFKPPHEIPYNQMIAVAEHLVGLHEQLTAAVAAKTGAKPDMKVKGVGDLPDLKPTVNPIKPVAVTQIIPAHKPAPALPVEPDVPVMAGPVWNRLTIAQAQARKASGDIVKLSNANAQYQPTKGSSANSVYWVVAGNNKCAISARYTNGLSLRLEAKQAPSKGFWEQAALAGFEVKTNYASMHTGAVDDMTAARVIASVCAGMMMEFDTLPAVGSILKVLG